MRRFPYFLQKYFFYSYLHYDLNPWPWQQELSYFPLYCTPPLSYHKGTWNFISSGYLCIEARLLISYQKWTIINPNLRREARLCSFLVQYFMHANSVAFNFFLVWACGAIGLDIFGLCNPFVCGWLESRTYQDEDISEFCGWVERHREMQFFCSRCVPVCAVTLFLAIFSHSIEVEASFCILFCWGIVDLFKRARADPFLLSLWP